MQAQCAQPPIVPGGQATQKWGVAPWQSLAVWQGFAGGAGAALGDATGALGCSAWPVPADAGLVGFWLQDARANRAATRRALFTALNLARKRSYI